MLIQGEYLCVEYVILLSLRILTVVRFCTVFDYSKFSLLANAKHY